MSQNYKTILFIPQKGDPKLERIEWIDGMDKLLKTKDRDHKTISWLEDDGYMLGIFGKDIIDKNDVVNEKGSFYGKCVVNGDCVLYDDNKDLTESDIKKITKLTKELDLKQLNKKCQDDFEDMIKGEEAKGKDMSMMRALLSFARHEKNKTIGHNKNDVRIATVLSKNKDGVVGIEKVCLNKEKDNKDNKKNNKNHKHLN